MIRAPASMRDRQLGLRRALRPARRARCAARVIVQRLQLRRAQRRDNQQHRVGAGRLRLEQLILRDDEILAQQRDVDRRAHRRQVLERAVEERRLGQHRDRRRAGRRVAASRSPPDRSRRAARPCDGDRRLHSAMTLTRSVRRQRRREAARARRRGAPRARPAPPAARAASRTSTMRRVAATIVASRSGAARSPSRRSGRANSSAVEIDDQRARASASRRRDRSRATPAGCRPRPTTPRRR